MITVALTKGKGNESLYLQLYNGIKQLIASGELQPDDKLPSKKQLASHLQVSVKTVENAYFQLALEGYIRSKEKVGYFVNDLIGFRPPATDRNNYAASRVEDRWRLDIKSNETPEELFPLSALNRITRDVLNEQGRRLLETVPFNGAEELRVAIARHLRAFKGMELSPDQIVVGSGTEYLYGRIMQLLGGDCVVGVEDPGSSHMIKFLSNAQVEFRPIAMDAEGIRPDLLEASGCNIAHISPQHHFPTGLIMPVSRRAELFHWVNARPGRYIVEDDYNCEFLYQGNPIAPMFETDAHSKVIYMNTFSKTISPAVRVAYMVLPKELMSRYEETLSFYACTVSSLAQYQVARFISDGYLDRYIHRVRQHNLSQRKLVVRAVAESPLAGRIEVQRSLAGTHLLLKLDTDKSDREVLKTLRDNGILASFVTQYLIGDEPQREHLLVLNYSRVTEDDMAFLLGVLAAALD